MPWGLMRVNPLGTMTKVLIWNYALKLTLVVNKTT